VGAGLKPARGESRAKNQASRKDGILKPVDCVKYPDPLRSEGIKKGRGPTLAFTYESSLADSCETRRLQEVFIGFGMPNI
jgi:hypothetical protein